MIGEAIQLLQDCKEYLSNLLNTPKKLKNYVRVFNDLSDPYIQREVLASIYYMMPLRMEIINAIRVHASQLRNGLYGDSSYIKSCIEILDREIIRLIQNISYDEKIECELVFQIQKIMFSTQKIHQFIGTYDRKNESPEDITMLEMYADELELIRINLEKCAGKYQ